jgi:hypothetical protein
MKLDAARLCLDCDEIHEDQICPTCSSEAFAFVTRWVKTSGDHRVERRAAPVVQPATTPHARTPEQIEAFRQLIEGKPERPAGPSLMTKSVVGLAAVSLLGWAWKAAGSRAVPGARSQVPGRDPGSREARSKAEPDERRT